MRFRVLALSAFLQLYSIQCFADLPLTVEDLLTQSNQFRLSLDLGYANVDRRNTDRYFHLVQTGTSNFIMLPVAISEQRQNSDTLTMTLSGRYGLNNKTELYSHLTATSNSSRIYANKESTSVNSQQLSQLVVGTNHQFSEDNDSPALLAFAEVALAENTAIDGTDYQHFKTGQIGFTTYRSIDPLVLSLSAGYRQSWQRHNGVNQVDPGDLLFINPSIGFAVNNQVTLTGGVQFKFRGKDKIDGSELGIRTSQTNLELGFGYASSEQLTINLSIRNDISGNTGAQANLRLLYKIKYFTQQ
jgi:hypothetical protein